MASSYWPGETRILIQPFSRRRPILIRPGGTNCVPPVLSAICGLWPFAGGEVAWAAAQRQAIEPVEGYLGAISASPVTDLLDLSSNDPLLGILVMFTVYALQQIYPEFDHRDVLTPQAARRWELYQQLEAGDDVGFSLLLGIDLIQTNWRQNPYMQDFIQRTGNGGKPISGPLLVLQGLAATNIDAGTAAIRQVTCTGHPQSQLQYQAWDAVTHVPILYAAQQVWLHWIADRFAGKPVAPRCEKTTQTAMLPRQRYQSDPNWIVESETEMYKLALP